MHPTYSFRQLFSVLFLLFIGLLAATLLQAWTGPIATAPNGNVTAPVNAGTVDQVKNAGLSIKALTVFGSAYIQNKLGIATSAPAVALDVNGTVKIGNAGEVCQSVSEGAIRYNSSSKIVEYCNGSVWGPITHTAPTGLTITSNVFNYNIYTAAGSPTTATNVTVTINSGVLIGSSDPDTPSMVTGTFPSGSVITIVYNGTIIGAGGPGGAGSTPNGVAGGPGGAALSLASNVVLTNNGVIKGGGGGGGGSAQYARTFGGSGGGGCGYVGGAAGTGQYGGTGQPGSSSGGGSGSNPGLPGGSGGACGSTGSAGQNGPIWVGGVGGAAGAAIVTNGNTITWTAGNNGTQVLGAVQ